MPRIDPLQLLDCLKVLLTPNGGIKSDLEVKRLTSLMQKFSKKLVSKCIYIQILKCSETELLGLFMETGGWMMTHSWLEDAINTDNWPLVQEILELFLLCPVDVNRLRSNSAPKLVKNLSKEGKHERVKILSARLVEQWLKLVKGETVALPATNHQIIVDPGFQQNAAPHQMQLLDPSHPSYADSLAIVGDELGGLGTLGYADIDVDEIIPTISHHGHAAMEVTDQEVVDGAFMGPSTAESEVVAASEVVLTEGGTRNSNVNSHSSLSSNNNVNQNDSEKDNLKIKITMKDGKTKVTTSNSGKDADGKTKSSSSSRSEHRSGSTSDKERSSKDRKSSSSKSSSSSSSHKSSSSSSSSSSSRRGHSSSSKSSSSSSSSSSRDKDRDRDKDRSSSHKSSSSSSSSKSSSSSSRSKESVSQADKDKDTLTKVLGSGAATLEKLGKIPKKPKTEEAAAAPAKKPSISIEVRKDPENRPKTVKTFNSQFRNHGLVEDIPPPPSRKTLKKPEAASATTTTTKSSSNTTTAISSLKRTSPPKELSPVSEKRQKLDQIAAASPTEEKPGGVKLIAPRSKPTLIESDMFMDALCSSAVPTAKGNPKKRKRVASTSKDGSPPPPSTPDSPKIVAAPMKFYQDTLDDNQQSAATATGGVDATTGEESPSKKAANAEATRRDDETSANPASPSKEAPSSPGAAGDDAEDTKSPTSPAKSDGSSPDSPAKEAVEEMEVEEDNTPKPPGPGCGPNGPPGVLVLHRRRAAKKSVRWRPQEQLEEVRLFELDETERVNVTKTFTDMKQMERFGERDAFQMARKLQNDDVMVEQTAWAHLIEVDDVPQTASGGQSKEKDVQAARELTCLQALYFSYNMIPDSASEPEAETYKYAEPGVIPLEDAQNTVNDFTKQGWPEPKEHGMAGGIGGGGGGPFNNGMMGAGGAFDNPFAAGGPFVGAGGGNQNMPFGGNPAIWAAGGGPPPQFVNGVPPFGPNMNSEEIKLAMNRLAFPGQTFNPPNFNGINMMNLPAMGAGGPMGGGPGGPWGGGPGGFRGGPPPMGGVGGVWRGHGPPPQQQQNGGMGGNGGPRGREWQNNNNSMNSRPCKNYKKGFCKKADQCNFSHAGAPGGFNR